MTSARWWRTATVAGVVVLGAAAWWLAPRPRFRLPPRIRIEEGLVDLAASFRHANVVEEHADDPVRLGGIGPGFHLSVAGGYRQGIVAPASAVVRFRPRVPAGAKLTFAVGVERKDDQVRQPAAVRFTVEVDGRARFVRVLDPGTRRDDRVWVDAAIDLGVAEEREMEIALRTEPVGDASLAVPAWSHVRLVRETWRERQAAGPGAPNVIVLLVDTLRAGDLGCYGARPSPSPTLDRLAAGGRLFTQAIAQAPWTLPSVTSLFTGRDPSSHGVVGGQRVDAKDGGYTADRAFLADTIPTFAEEASAAGITTMAVVTNALVSRRTNLSRGFETFVELDWAKSRRGWPPAAEVNRTFLAWLAENRDRRFLAYLHYMDVHDPYTPPPTHRPAPPPGIRQGIADGKSAEFAVRINEHGDDPLPAADVEYLRQLYDGEIAGWDDELARLLDGLDRAGLRQSTAIVVTADHGEEFQEHGMLSHRPHVYEECVRVPLVVAGPGVAPGRVTAQVQGVDLFPTLAALMGFRVPPGLRGENVLAAPETRPAFIETAKGRTLARVETPLVAVRLPGWKLIEAPVLGEYELYDLSADPEERHDVFAGNPEAARLAGLIADWRAHLAAPPSPAGSRPDVLEKMRELGYVE